MLVKIGKRERKGNIGYALIVVKNFTKSINKMAEQNIEKLKTNFILNAKWWNRKKELKKLENALRKEYKIIYSKNGRRPRWLNKTYCFPRILPLTDKGKLTKA